MHHFAKRLLVIAAPLLLTGCLWGPGKFTSDLALRKDGSFILDYRGEVVLQTPPDADKSQPWSPDIVRCRESGSVEIGPFAPEISAVDDKEFPKDPIRKCTPAEIDKAKGDHEKREAERVKSKREEVEQMAKMFGLPGFDDESNRAFAAKLGKYAGYRSVQYRGNGVFDVDYHFEGRATQDFVFPMLPDNDVLIPFITIRRRSDGSVLVTAPAMTGAAGPLAARAGSAAAGAAKNGPISRAQGRFTVVTDGEVLTNNSEDGPVAHPTGRALHWDITASYPKMPEALIRLR